MNAKLKKLLRELDRKLLPSWLEEEVVRLGKWGYDSLFSALKKGGLGERQIANILHLLVKVRFHGDQDELFIYLLRFVTDRRERVRAAAVRLVIGLVRIANGGGFSGLNAPAEIDVFPLLQRSLKMGFKNPTFTDYVRDYISQSWNSGE